MTTGELARLESQVQPGLAAKAAIIFGAFLPEVKHGSGIGDCVDGGGRCPEKENGPTPLTEVYRRRSQALRIWMYRHNSADPSEAKGIVTTELNSSLAFSKWESTLAK